jgi:erythromycin esterase
MRHALGSSVLLSLVLAFPAAAADLDAFLSWSRTQALPIGGTGSDKAFAALGARLDGVRLIGVGESVHESQEFAAFRLELLRHLVRHHRVTALVLESGLPEVMAVDAWVRGRPDAVRPDMTLAIRGSLGAVAETHRAMEWLREWNLGEGKARPVGVHGADLSGHAGDLTPALDKLAELTAENAEIRARVDAVRPLAAKVADRWFRPSTEKYGKLSAEDKAALTAATNRLVEATKSYRGLDPDRSAWARQLGQLLLRHEEMLRFGAYSPEVSRDVALAETTLFVVGRLPAGERAVYWAHNAHVQRVRFNSLPPMPAGSFPLSGERFAAALGKAYFALGTAYGGASRDQKIAAPADSVDGALERAATGTFLLPLWLQAPPDAAAWLDEERLMRFQVTHTRLALGEAFDAVVYFDRATAAERPAAPKS